MTTTRPRNWRSYPYWRAQRRSKIRSILGYVVFLLFWAGFLLAVFHSDWSDALLMLGSAWFFRNTLGGAS